MLDYKRRSDGKLKGKMASDISTNMITSNEPVSIKQNADSPINPRPVSHTTLPARDFRLDESHVPESPYCIYAGQTRRTRSPVRDIRLEGPSNWNRASPTGHRYPSRYFERQSDYSSRQSHNLDTSSERPYVRNAYLGISNVDPVEPAKTAAPPTDDIEADHSTDPSSRDANDRCMDFGIGQNNPITEITLNDLTSSRADWFRGYLGMMERKEGFNIKLVRIQDAIVLQPQKTLREWLEKYMHLFRRSAWKTRVEELMSSPMSQYLDLLPEPARPRSGGCTRSFTDSMLHLSISMAYAFTEFSEHDEDKLSFVIMQPILLKFFEFVSTFRCFTDGVTNEELDVRDMHARERRMMTVIFAEYARFSISRIREERRDVTSAEVRRTYHRYTGYAAFRFRGEYLTSALWDKLEAYGRGRYHHFRTGLRQLSYMLVSQGFKLLEGSDYVFPQYDGDRVDSYKDRRMAFHINKE